VAYAAENDMDLIAIRLPWWRRDRLALGSVAQKVIAHASAAVLLWRVTEAKPPTLKDEMYYSMQTP